MPEPSAPPSKRAMAPTTLKLPATFGSLNWDHSEYSTPHPTPREGCVTYLIYSREPPALYLMEELAELKAEGVLGADADPNSGEVSALMLHRHFTHTMRIMTCDMVRLGDMTEEGRSELVEISTDTRIGTVEFSQHERPWIRVHVRPTSPKMVEDMEDAVLHNSECECETNIHMGGIDHRETELACLSIPYEKGYLKGRLVVEAGGAPTGSVPKECVFMFSLWCTGYPEMSRNLKAPPIEDKTTKRRAIVVPHTAHWPTKGTLIAKGRMSLENLEMNRVGPTIEMVEVAKVR
ncbi:hypothetical protein KIPB_001931 [Kipferlia bialata]|uniref:Uncharacterized protein n=1 Tax=Kipferlia bialata TaxID=797122 RepID=A0A9K3CRK0_9EUKA|nr:hypothetical protein KIPB_001931 [Kipferlia bialata]|eukprot:g1931.t1